MGKAGLGESCSHIASALFYLEAWTKINAKLSCMQVKCSWILPSYVKEVEYARVRDINFTSAKKMKADLDATLDGLLETSQASNSPPDVRSRSKIVPFPSDGRGDRFFLR